VMDLRTRIRYDVLVDMFGEPPDTSRSLRLEVRLVARDFVLPATVVALVAVALIPLPRPFAWLTLSVVPFVLASHLGRASGITGAVTSVVLLLWAHGDPRFTTTVTNQSTIRWAFLLGLAGVFAAYVGAARRDGGARGPRHVRAPHRSRTDGVPAASRTPSAVRGGR
jgi:hypothetical protein